MVNPFRYGQVVTARDFCPRPKLIKTIKEFMASGQNTVVFGERRIGKTSLIHEAARRLRKKRLLHVDLLEIKNSDDFCSRLVKAILSLEQQGGFLEKALKTMSRLKPSVSVDPLTGQPTVSLDPAVKLQPESIEGVLDLILSAQKRKPLVVVLDEFQDILNLKESKEVLARLRGRIQFHANIPYVFAGSIRSRMDEIFNDPDSPFFKSSIPVQVGPLDRNLFATFLRDKFASGKRSIGSDTLERVFDVSGDIPGDIQQFCEAIWETTSYKEKITGNIIPESLKLIFSRENKGYEATLVMLTGQQLNCLVGLAKVGGKSPFSAPFLKAAGIALPASVKKALNRMEQLKIVFRYEGEYRFVNPFFKAWLIFKNF